MTIDETKEILKRAGYMADGNVATTVWAAMAAGKPLLVEGAPGVGKTALAKAVADGMGLPLIRMQMYDGLTDDKILYDYDYQRQLLTLEAVKPQLEERYRGMDASDVIKDVAAGLDFYGEEFLIRRPVLRSITGEERSVLLIDEIDKAPEEIEYMLYEFLEDFSITIPQYGEVRCPEDRRPVVFLTSNGYRDLSGALRRRCMYLYIERKTKEEVMEVLRVKAGADETVAAGVAFCMAAMQNASGIRRMPSTSEAIDWARLLMAAPERTKEYVDATLGAMIKNEKDASAIRRAVETAGKALWEGGA